METEGMTLIYITILIKPISYIRLIILTRNFVNVFYHSISCKNIVSEIYSERMESKLIIRSNKLCGTGYITICYDNMYSKFDNKFCPAIRHKFLHKYASDDNKFALLFFNYFRNSLFSY